MLFLCVGGIVIGALYYVFTEVLCYVDGESNCFLRDGTAGDYVGNRLGIGNGWPASSCVWNLGCVTASGDVRLCVSSREERLSVMN